MKKKLLKILAVASMLITSFPAMPVFASGDPTPKTVQVGPQETYTSLKELFDGMANEGSVALTVELTGDTVIDGDLVVPRDKGIDALTLKGNESTKVSTNSNASLFMNGAESRIEGVVFGKNISIYGGGNGTAVSGNTNLFVKDSTINGTVYAGSLNGSVSGKTDIGFNNSKINVAVLGSNGAANKLNDASINSSEFKSLYLGNVNANTSGVPEHSFARSEIENVYISKNGTVSGDVTFFANIGKITVDNFANGQSVSFDGKTTVAVGVDSSDGATLNVGKLSWGTNSDKPAVYVAEKSALKLNDNQDYSLGTVELVKSSKLYLSSSCTMETLKTNNATIYLADGKMFTVNNDMQGNATVDFTKTYKEGDVVVAIPTENSTSKIYEDVEGVSLVKGFNATNAIWTYSEDVTVTVSVGEGGTTPNKTLYVGKGGELNVSFAPNEGYVLDSVKVDGVDVTSTVDGQVITLSNVQSNKLVEITFKAVDLASVKNIIDNLPTQYSGVADRDAILNAKILFEDFGGKNTLGTTYAQKMNNALMLLPQIEFASSSKHATVTNPEAIISSMTKADAEKILNGTYSKIVFGIYEDKLSSVGRQVIMDAQLYGDDTRTFYLKFGKRYVYTDTSKADTFKNVNLTNQNTVNVTVIPTEAEKKPASGYNDRRMRIYYSETVWTEEVPVTPEVHFLADTTPSTTEYTTVPNKLGAYVVTTWDVNSPSKDSFMIVFKCASGYFLENHGYLPKILFLEKNADGSATLSKDLIPTDMVPPLVDEVSTDGYWTPSIDTSEGAIKTDMQYIWTFTLKKADYTAVNEAIEKASIYTAENAEGYSILKKALDAVVWGLDATEQKRVDKMAEDIHHALLSVYFKLADYTQVDIAIYEGRDLILRDWVTNPEEFEQAVAAVDRTKNITQQAEVDAMAQRIRNAIDKFIFKPGDYSLVNNMIAVANTYDKTLYQNWEIVEEAIGAVVWGLGINKQDEINEMGVAIDSALSMLYFKTADYTEIYSLIETFNKDYKESPYYSEAAISVIQSAIDSVVYGKQIDKQAEVDTMAEAIRNALNNTEPELADYSYVNDQIAQAETYNKEYYENYTKVEEAIAAVDWNVGIREQYRVDEMGDAIFQAMQELIYKSADYSALNAALKRAEAYTPAEDYDGYGYLQNAIDSIVWDLKIDRQSEVDYMTATINELIDQLKFIPADYSEIEQLLERAESYDETLYVNWDAVEKAITEIDWTKGRSKQSEVNTMAKNLYDALENLALKGADYSALKAALKRIEGYIPEDWENYEYLQNAIDDINWNYSTGMQDEVDAMTANINKLIDELVFKYADYSEVERLMDRAESYNKDLYKNWSDVETAVNNIIWDLGASKQAEVNKMARDLYDALENLQLKGADYSELQAAVDKFYELDPNLYGDAYYDLEWVIENIYWDYGANEQHEVDAMTEEILNAIENLTPIRSDYTEVNKAIERANKIHPAQIVDYSKVEEAINAVVWDLPYEEQERVNGFAAAINAAVDALEYKPADYYNVDAAIEEANALNEALFKNFSIVADAINSVVRGYDIRKQEEVNKMANDIRDAISRLEYKPADYARLNATIAVAEEKALNKDLYKNFSMVQNVLDKIQMNLDIRYQNQIDNWNQELMTAIDELVYKAADYAAVDKAIEQANKLNPNSYVNFSAVTDAINAVVRGKNITQQAEVDAMAKAINDAVAALKYKGANYEAVDEAITRANNVDKDLYKNFEIVTNAINAVVRGYDITKQDEVDSMADAILRAIVLLEYKDADYTAVDEAIARAHALDRNLYKDFSGVVIALEKVQRGKDITEQASVDAMAKAINDAINSLEYKDADYTAVDEAIAKAEALNKDLYKNYSVVTNAINAVVRGKNITEQASVDAMAKAINDAIDALEYKDADYTAIDKAIDDANKLNKDLYKDFTEVTNAINSVVRGKNITEQAEVDAMAKAINDAINALEYKDADYSRVDALIAIVEGLNRSEFEDLSAVDAAVSAVVRGKNITQQTEVDAMAEAIQKALDEACDFADYTEVEKAIETFENLEQNLYTSETLKDVQDAIDAVIWNKASKNQALVDAMAKAINDAIDALEYKDADYTAVDKAIEKSQEFDQNLYINFDEVTDAINAVVRGKDIREQAAVDAMAKAINDAIEGLEYKDADYTAVREAIAKAEALNKDLYKDFSAVTAAINSVNWLKDIRSQDKVDAMAKAINDAIDALEYRDADYSAVEKAIEEANKLNKDLYKNFEIVTNAIDAVDYTKDITEQNEVDAMAKAITDAINTLEYKDADYTAVDKAIADAEELNKDLYKNFEVVTNSINAVVRGKNITEQTVVDAMAKAITDAIDALEYKSADYTAVDKAIADANQVNKDLYKNFEIVTNTINAVDRNKNITEQAEVDAMAKAINDAVAQLEYKDADYTAVDKAITKANSLDKTLFKDFTKVTEAINAVVRGKDIREQATVDAMAKAINDAIDGLRYNDADYTAVDAAIKNAKTYNLNLYVNGNAVTKAINAVDRNKDFTQQAEVDAMAKAINDAVDALEYKAADYTAVDKAIAKANALDKKLYKDFTKVTAAINAVVRDKDITEQKAVDAMAKAINDAIAKLEYKSFSVKFDANGGTNLSAETITKTYGSSLGELPTVTRNGFKFLGWFTKKDGGTQITTTTKMGSTNPTYYAHWEQKETGVFRIFGSNRYQTAFKVGITLKGVLDADKVDTIIIASGKGFADALAGNYLAAKKNAPIIMTDGKNAKDVQDYIVANVKKGGTVYVLGGTAAVPSNVTKGLKGYTVKRLAGKDRYETNLAILKEAGVNGEDVLISTGKNFADSLSASATGKPILLVDKKLTASQREFLSGLKDSDFYVLGGVNAVSKSIENSIKGYGTVVRLAGDSRYETSVMIAKTFFKTPSYAVVAYGKNYPDGLSGGALAYQMGGPLLLVENKAANTIANYTASAGITSGVVLGGSGLISDSTARKIFKLEVTAEIVVK